MMETGENIQCLPNDNRGLERNLGGFDTLVEGLEYAARGQTGFCFYSSRGALEQVLPYRVLRERAIETGRRLVRSGLRRGERVGVIAETTPEFMDVFFGCQYAGLIPCPMPYSMQIGGRDAFVARLAGMMKAAGMSAVIGRLAFMGDVGRAAKAAGVTLVLTHDDLAGVSSSNVDLSPFCKDDVAYIQYSSGSTSDPKGVLITQKSITTNARCILENGLRIRPGDRGMSWLPLYHDMGLVGFCLSAVMGQGTVDYLATTAFARRPLLWLKIMSDNRATCSFAPTFGYDLLARRVNGDARNLDLSAWRVAGIGGDMVRADVLERFARALAPAKFDKRAFLPSYGMAETTLAASFADAGEGYQTDTIDRELSKQSGRAIPASRAALEDDAGTRTFVVCGRAIPGHEMMVCDAAGNRLDDREIGRILIKGPSLMAGYFNNDDATAAALSDDGWLDTGDMGYKLDGRIVITGRVKDMILHNGRNIWPQDIEWAVERIEGLRSGDVAAFAIEDDEGEERVVVLVQCRLPGAEEREALRREAAALIVQHAGIECDIVLISSGSLPFTSSGKLSRAAARQRFLDGAIGVLSHQIDPSGRHPRVEPMRRTA